MADRYDIGFDQKGFIASDAMAPADLRLFFDRSHCSPYLQISTGDSEANQNTDGNAEFGKVESDVVAGDNACFFKSVDALGNCGRREADLPADLSKGLAGIVLQGFQYLPGNCIKFEGTWNGSVRHMASILR